MLLSTEKRFIFIHIPKSAGSSITYALTPYSLSPEKSQFRRLLSHLPVSENPEKAWLRAHDKASWLRLKLPPEIYNSYCKFAVVRNPFDYAVSYYFSVRKNPKSNRHASANRQSFSEFLRSIGRKNNFTGITQSSWVTDRSGQIIIDRVLRFEHFDNDVAELFADLGIDRATAIPYVNTTKHEPYRYYYSDADRKFAERLFARDLELFGYSF